MNTTNTRLKQTARLMSLNLMAAIEDYPHVQRVEMFTVKARDGFNTLGMLVLFHKQKQNHDHKNIDKLKDYRVSFRPYSNRDTNTEWDLLQTFSRICSLLTDYSIYIDHKSLIPQPAFMGFLGFDQAAEGAEMTVAHTQIGRTAKTSVGGVKNTTPSRSRSLGNSQERREKLNMLAFRFAANLVAKLSNHPEVYHIETISSCEALDGVDHTRVRIAWQGGKAINICLYDSDEPTFDAFLAKVEEACNLLNSRGVTMCKKDMLRRCGLNGRGIAPAWAVPALTDLMKPSMDADAEAASQQYQKFTECARRQGKTYPAQATLADYSQMATVDQIPVEIVNHSQIDEDALMREHLKASMPAEFEMPQMPDELVIHSKAALEKKNREHLKERLTNKDILETESKKFTSIRDTLR